MRVLICLLASFGTIMLVLIAAEMVRYTPRSKKDNIYKLCERYIDSFNHGDGYWLTDTEIQLYEELEERLKCLKVIK